MAGNRVNLSSFLDEEQEEFMRAKRRRGFSRPLVFIVVIVTAIFVMSLFFRVEEIEVEGNTHYTDEEIIRAIEIEEGDNLFFFDRFAAVGRVFAKLPYVEEVSVKRALPNHVTISVRESAALAYLILGEEQWTMDHNCKILGKATEEETATLLPIQNFDPGTLFIGERLESGDENDEDSVPYLAEILQELEGREMIAQATRLNFENIRNPELSYGGKYTILLGPYSSVDQKFSMLAGVLETLKEGDTGIIDLSDGRTAHFSPN